MLNDEHLGTNSNKVKGLQVIFYLLIVNLIFNTIITLVNCFVIPNYFSELLSFSLVNVLSFTIVLIITMIITIIPVFVGQQYRNWSEDFALKFFFKTLTILSLSLISLVSIAIYFTLFSNYPLLDNPFSFSNSNQVLSILSPFWWFFSYNVGLILIFLLYIYLES